MWTCAPAYFRKVLSDVGRFIALFQQKKWHLWICVARNSKSKTARVMKLYKEIDQRVTLCTCIFLCRSSGRRRSYSPFFSKKWHLCKPQLHVYRYLNISYNDQFFLTNRKWGNPCPMDTCTCLFFFFFFCFFFLFFFGGGGGGVFLNVTYPF